MPAKWFDKLTIPSEVEGKSFFILPVLSLIFLISSICGTAKTKAATEKEAEENKIVIEHKFSAIAGADNTTSQGVILN